MSKEKHTPTICKSIIIKPKNELTNSDIKEIGRVLDYHDRLVEALEHCIKMISESHVSANLVDEHARAVINYQYFLTELKA